MKKVLYITSLVILCISVLCLYSGWVVYAHQRPSMNILTKGINHFSGFPKLVIEVYDDYKKLDLQHFFG
ncbi:hypothetical protein, partial [Flammeovirga sp. OC4]|uniref:hypothetical protein n=1 Tax=Flammeovirga sp. OC4 TaxID=1382345 RepID=UPI001C0F927A